MVREAGGHGKMTKVLTADEAAVQHGEGELEAARHADLVEERRQLVLDGLLGRAEARRDFAVGAAVEQRVKDLAFTRRQVERRHDRSRLWISSRPMATRLAIRPPASTSTADGVAVT